VSPAAISADESQRIDRWLWSARFFKTRSLAAAAVAGGKVQVDGQRVKPARRIRPGVQLQVRRGVQLQEVEVVALATRRGPASEAATLYRESEASLERRRDQRERAAQHAARRARGLGRPSKRDRREIDRLKAESEFSRATGD